MDLKEVLSNADLVCVAGSRLYGVHDETSDVDLRGFWLPPAPYILGRNKFEQIESEQQDTCIYSFTKWLHLLEIGSPNVIELLFLQSQNIQRITPLGQHVLNHRDLFLSKKCITSIIGFSTGQWKSVQGYDTRKLGKKRKESVEKFGYAPKSAYHAIRLLWQGWELCDSKSITFPSPLAKYLKDIKMGVYSLRDLNDLYEESLSKLQKAESQTKLPEKVDKERVDNLFYECTKQTIEDWYRQINYR